MLFVAGYFTLQNNSSGPEGGKPDSSILNRDQTEEWKGWMQFMFLLYHYYHAEVSTLILPVTSFFHQFLPVPPP